MKKLLILINICIMMYSCNSNYQLKKDDSKKIFDVLQSLNSFFYPENQVIIYKAKRNIWKFYDGSGTEVSELDRISSIKEKIKLLESMNIATDDFIKRLHKTFEKNDTINFGMLLTNHAYGDQMLKVLPKREDVYKEDCDDWLGDDEIISMSEEEFVNFLQERIYAVSSKKAVFRNPYIETSLALCQGRSSENYVYYFIKNKEGKWLLDDIKIEEEK